MNNFYNPYNNGIAGMPYMSQNYAMPTYQAPQVQQPTQQIISPNDFTLMRYMNDADAEKFLPEPNSRVLLIDRNNQTFRIKACDNLGNSQEEVYAFTKVNKQVKAEAEKPAIDTSNFVTKQDVADYIKKSDLEPIFNRLSDIDKKIKIQKILKEEKIDD